MDQTAAVSPAQLFEQFFGTSIFRPWGGKLLDAAKPRAGESVLDLACATGVVARLLAARLGPASRVVGLDINPEMLAVARARAEDEGVSIEWRVGDATELDFPDDTFDLVVCQQGLQFFPDQQKAVAEMHRTLTRRGRAVVSVWERLQRQPVYEALFEAEAEYLDVPVTDLAIPFQGPQDEELRSMFEAAGFRNIAVNQVAMQARFPSADKFVELTLRAGAAVVPSFMQGGLDSFEELLGEVNRRCRPVLERFRDGEALEFPMYNLMVVASR